MKTAEEWIPEIQSCNNGLHLLFTHGKTLEQVVKQIQLDAYKQACSDCINNICLDEYVDNIIYINKIEQLRDSKTLNNI